MSSKRYLGVLCWNLLDRLSYTGEPQTWEQKYEFTKEMAEKIAPLLPGRPIRHEHRRVSAGNQQELVPLGRVVRAFVGPAPEMPTKGMTTGPATPTVTASGNHPQQQQLALMVEFELEDDSTLRGKAARTLVESGMQPSLSLSHCFVNGQIMPLEVSICTQGARENTLITGIIQASQQQQQQQQMNPAAYKVPTAGHMQKTVVTGPVYWIGPQGLAPVPATLATATMTTTNATRTGVPLPVAMAAQQAGIDLHAMTAALQNAPPPHQMAMQLGEMLQQQAAAAAGMAAPPPQQQQQLQQQQPTGDAPQAMQIDNAAAGGDPQQQQQPQQPIDESKEAVDKLQKDPAALGEAINRSNIDMTTKLALLNSVTERHELADQVKQLQQEQQALSQDVNAATNMLLQTMLNVFTGVTGTQVPTEQQQQLAICASQPAVARFLTHLHPQIVQASAALQKVQPTYAQIECQKKLDHLRQQKMQHSTSAVTTPSVNASSWGQAPRAPFPSMQQPQQQQHHQQAYPMATSYPQAPVPPAPLPFPAAAAAVPAQRTAPPMGQPAIPAVPLYGGLFPNVTVPVQASAAGGGGASTPRLAEMSPVELGTAYKDKLHSMTHGSILSKDVLRLANAKLQAGEKPASYARKANEALASRQPSHNMFVPM